eukprot:UN00276
MFWRKIEKNFGLMMRYCFVAKKKEEKRNQRRMKRGEGKRKKGRKWEITVYVGKQVVLFSKDI